MDFQKAVNNIINKVHAYMRANPHSELHQQGKMFGVLQVESGEAGKERYLAAFSAQLDGSYFHEGFVPPVYAMPTPPVGTGKEESRRLQRLLFANYRFVNGLGETKDLLEIFADEKPIVSPEDWFKRKETRIPKEDRMPPSGAGECCAPKLLQYALSQGLKPVRLAEFWIGASPRYEIRQEGVFYPPCSGRCMPILRHMTKGLHVEFVASRQAAPAVLDKIQTIYEDEYLMVVHKPAGLLSVPGKTDEISLTGFLSQQNNGAYIMPVHRLDQDTSGLIVIAKKVEIYKELQSYFQRRDIQKRYEALLAPNDSLHPVPDEGEINLPLLPNPYDRPRQMANTAHGKVAITRFHVRERRDNGLVFVDFYPLTGRTHQLRVHAAHPDGLNAPIVGDRLYGKAGERLMLHAAEITFVHPVKKEEMHFCIPSNF